MDFRQVVKRLLAAGAILSAAGLCSLLVLLALLFNEHNRLVDLPAPGGPYAVGRVIYDWVDDSRPETLTPDPNDHRELAVWVWYPAEAQPGAQPAPYLPPEWQRAREREYGPLGVFLAQNPARVRLHAVENAPVAQSPARFPVLVFMPGLGPAVPDYTALLEELASQGYIVVGVNMAYSSDMVVFPDGRVARQAADGTVSDSATPEQAKAVLDRLVEVWAQDAQVALSRLETLNANDPAGRFTGRIDLGAAGVFGHSFGGAAAAQACKDSARFRAGIDIDGYPYGDVIQAGVRQPFMFLWSEAPDPADAAYRQAQADVQAIYARLPRGSNQATIQGARHFNFTDLAVEYAPVVRATGLLGPLDGRVGLALTARYVRDFFDQELRGQPQELLEQTSPAVYHEPFVGAGYNLAPTSGLQKKRRAGAVRQILSLK